jgi:hypothetical protein
MNWGCCVPEPQVTQFHFKNGTIVWDLDLEGAIERLGLIETHEFWATEIEPGNWEVQFEPYSEPFLIVNVPALDGLEAAAEARRIIKYDLKERELVREVGL